MEQTHILKSGLDKLKIKYTQSHIDKIMLYKHLMEEKNKVMNLTAITDENHIIVKHFLDSLSIYPHIIKPPINKGDCTTLKEKANCCHNGMKILDVGTGGGFPGVPLAIFFNDIQFTLLDSVRKKLIFVADSAKECDITNIHILHGRCEDLAHMSEHRGYYDIVISRAVAPMTVLIEITIPFTKLGGLVFAMKGPEALDELQGCDEKLKRLGGRVKDIIDLEVPFGDFKRKLVIIEKISDTPKKYPRKPKEIEQDKVKV